MMLLPPPSPARLLVLLLGIATGLLMVFGGVQVTQASCGDYLSHASRFEPSDAATESTHDGRALGVNVPRNVPTPRRCNGPNCSRQPAQPTPLPQRQRIETTERQLMSSASLEFVLMQPRESEFVDMQQRVLPAILTARLLRPPRFATTL